MSSLLIVGDLDVVEQLGLRLAVRFELLGEFSAFEAIGWSCSLIVFARKLVPLAGELRLRGERRVGVAAGLGVGMTFVLGPFGPLFFLMQGRDADLPTGTMITATVRPV